MHRFGHHSGDLLNPGKAVKFQRVKTLRGVFSLRQSGLHLGLGLQLDIA